MMWLKYLLIALLFVIVVRMLALVHLFVDSLAPILYFMGTVALGYTTLTQRSIYAVESTDNLIIQLNQGKRSLFVCIHSDCYPIKKT